MSELLAEVPPVGSATVQNGTTVCAVAPGRFLMAGPEDLFKRIETAFPAGDATMTDLSHARVILKLEGDAAAAALQTCVMLDLDPLAFPPGRVAQTVIHHIDVLISPPEGDALRAMGAEKLRGVAGRVAARRGD